MTTAEEIAKEIESIQIAREELKGRIESRKEFIDMHTRELQRMRAEESGLQGRQLNLRDSLQAALS